MNAQVIIDGNDVSGYLVSVERTKDYCEISQTFTIQLTLDYATAINTYDTVVIYEEGDKVLTGYVASVVKTAPEGVMNVSGQDVYKKAHDFFIQEETTVPDDTTTTRYWMEYYLSLAGLTASFTSGDGPYVPELTVLGLSHVSDIIEELMTTAGWYGNVDPDGNISFGLLDTTISGLKIARENNLLAFDTRLSYDKSRNIAHVHGGVEVSLDGITPIFAKAEVNLPYLPTDQIVVAANPLIRTQESAQNFADQLVSVLGRPNFVKKAEILGDPDFIAGKFIFVQDDLYSGISLITGFKSSFDSSGYTMSLTLDDFCPRIVAALGNIGETVYAGTAGSGIYRFDDPQWAAINEGLGGLNIYDFSTENGLFIASTDDGIYTKIVNNSWVRQNLPSATWSGGGAGALSYPAVYANAYGAEVNVLATDGTASWLYTGSIASGGGGFSWSSASINDNLATSLIDGKDLEGNYSSKYIVADGLGAQSYSGYSYLITDLYPIYTSYGDSNDFSRHSPPASELYVNFSGVPEPWVADWAYEGQIICADGNHLYALQQNEGGSIYKYNAETGSILQERTNSNVNFTQPAYCLGGIYAIWHTRSAGQPLYLRVERYPTSNISATQEILDEEIDTSDAFGKFLGRTLVLGGVVYFTYATSDGVSRVFGVSAAGKIFDYDVFIEGWDIASGVVADESGNLYLAYVNVTKYDKEEFNEYTEEFEYVNYTVYKYRFGKVGGEPSNEVSLETRDPNETIYDDYFLNSPANIVIAYTTASQAFFRVPEFGDIEGGIYSYSGNKLSSLDIWGADGLFIYAVDGNTFYKLNQSGGVVDTISGTFVNEDFLFTDDTIIFADASYLYEYNKNTLNLIDIYEIDDNISSIMLTGNVTFGGGNVYLVSEEVEYPVSRPITMLLDTQDNRNFYIDYIGDGFSEVNSDNISVLAVYGSSGIKYSDDYFSLIKSANLGIVHDAAGQVNNGNKLFYTASGIYLTTISTSSVLKNPLSASEIVARSTGDFGVFASVGGNVYKSVDDFVTYSGISNGLPGNTITVLRLGSNIA